jgi:hypothetical protein
MKLRKNLRALFAEYNAASAADKPGTALMKLKAAILALKDEATHPSLLITRADVVADIANDISMGMLGPGSTLKSRYDDFVWAHHQVMMLGPNGSSGPNFAHRGPAFGPWHRQLLKLFEEELRGAIGHPDLCLPYWDWTKDQSAADPGFPFTIEFLGGDGAGNPHDQVTTGAFSLAAGWKLNCDEEGFGYLRRHFGGDGPGLPTPQSVMDCLAVTPYDSSPWNWSSSALTSLRNVLEGWVGPRGIHNAVHRWVDGSMQPGTSPNDPVFFLHHCNIDRLWSIWEQKNPAQAPYLPDNSTAAANGLTRLNELMSTFGRTVTDRYFGVDVHPADVVNSKAITWYDSDLPDLQNETGPTLSFVNIPQGLTSYKAVKFKVTGGRPVHFRITGLPATPFGQTPMGTEFTATPDPNADFYFGYVWVQLVAAAAAVAPSAIDIHAYIVDEEGYYAATVNGEYPLGDFHVSLTGTTVPRENNSVCLVLDRSGSMADPAGGTSTKNSLLKTAVSVFNSLMLPNDEIALVSFDDQIATPAPMAKVSAATVPPVLSGQDLDPRGLTWIGGGLQQGSTELGSATHTNRSMLVLTDGVENVHPYVNELPAGTITNRTYAIGFGLPQDISVQVLNDVTANTHGDLIITGEISTDEQTFNLTKYFVQVLAGVSRMDILLDPQGILMMGSRHTIPFHVTDADVYADIIALCPLPQILDFTLITPSGDVIEPTTGGGNIEYEIKPQVAFYRINLPTLPANPQGSHAGTWQAVLSLKDRKDLDKLFNNREFVATAGAAFASGGLRYSLTAHAYSNLRFDARLRSDGYKPGATVILEAALEAYDVPFTGDAAVWADVTAPDASTMLVKLDRQGDGRFAGSFVATLPGVYLCRVRAEGYFRSKDLFTREKTLTAAVFNGDRGGSIGDDDPLCRLHHCLSDDKVLSPAFYRRLKKIGFDAEAFLECLESHCPPTAEHIAPKPRRRVKRAPANLAKAVRAEPQTSAAERPVVRPLPENYPFFQYPRVIRMFSKEDAGSGMGGVAGDSGKGDMSAMPRMAGMSDEAKDPGAKPKPPAKAFPRKVRRFSRPEEGGTD